MLQVCFSSANIYLFGMMKGRSTLIVKTNTISTKAAYVNASAAWWWMSCKWCQHLFLTMMCDTQLQGSDECADTLVHISPITVLCGRVLVAFSLSQSLLITSSFIHKFTVHVELCIFRWKWYEPHGIILGFPKAWVTKSVLLYKNNPF